MRAGLYARVSKDEQKTLNQLIELREYATRRGYDVEEFVDEGLSGSLHQDKRPALKRLLEAARLRKIDIIVCWRLDRFARSLKQLVDMVGDLEIWNVGFTTLRENIDTTTPSGRLVFHIFAALAEFERDLIVERTHLGLKRAIAQGKVLGRPRQSVDLALLQANLHLSVRKLAAKLNVPPATAARLKRRHGVPNTLPENGHMIVGKKALKS